MKLRDLFKRRGISEGYEGLQPNERLHRLFLHKVFLFLMFMVTYMVFSFFASSYRFSYAPYLATVLCPVLFYVSLYIFRRWFQIEGLESEINVQSGVNVQVEPTFGEFGKHIEAPAVVEGYLEGDPIVVDKDVEMENILSHATVVRTPIHRNQEEEQ